MLKQIWQRYLLKEILSVFFLFLFSFYFLYVLIDYSTHVQDFLQKDQIQLQDTLLFYSYQFVKRASILLPLALLVATIKVLTMMNSRLELVALLTAGIPMRKLLRPFLVIGIFCSSLLYLNSEFLLPKALVYTDAFHQKNFRNAAAREKHIHLHVWHLEDGSKMLYQNYDAQQKIYFDVFWICSSHDIWKIKYLSTATPTPTAHYADHIERNQSGELEKTESFVSKPFPNLKLASKATRQGVTPIESRPISKLVKFLYSEDRAGIYKISEVKTQLLYKVLIPLLPILAPLAVAPFCICYRRSIPVYFIYTGAIFGFIVFYTVIDSMVILAQNQILSPLLALLAPMLLCIGWFSYKFVRNT